jgi:hypothetical protein
MNCVFREDGTILLNNVRISYPHIFEPWGKNPTDKKKYSARFLLSKATHTPDIKALLDHSKKMETEEFKKVVGGAHRFIRNGDESGKPEEAGHWTVSASEDTAPRVIDGHKKDVDPKSKLIYPGCVVNALIRPWPQNNQWGTKINANLLAVQFVKDGDRLGNGPNTPDIDDVFGEVASDDFEEDGL